MRALEFREFGTPDVLKLVTRPDPVASPDMAVIEVCAASINPSDVKNVSGHMEGTVLPRIPGRDFSGRVIHGPSEWLGADVWGTGGNTGFSIDGSHATHILVPVDALVKKPANLSHAQAASIGVTFVIAWLGTVTYGQVKAGETIAVVGAGGGVGGAVVQIAKSKRLRVLAVDRKPLPGDAPAAKLIDGFVNSTEADWPQQIITKTEGRGVDLLFDCVGGVMFEPSLKTLAHRGRLIEISATGKRRVEFDLVDFYHHEQCILGADSRKLDVTASAKLMAEFTARFAEGTYAAPLIAATYSLAEAQYAYLAVDKGTVGRVALLPQEA
jgi:NADPH2:quinone reductase